LGISRVCWAALDFRAALRLKIIRDYDEPTLGGLNSGEAGEGIKRTNIHNGERSAHQLKTKIQSCLEVFAISSLYSLHARHLHCN
jgi:hypothetical protein